jgi:hypothetical protein
MITINVTKKDILKGERENACKCPIALAIKRKTKKLASVYNISSIYINGIKYQGDTANDIIKIDYFIKSFDSGLSVKPMKINLITTREASGGKEI